MAAVEIIIPLYNKERTVGRTIESVLAQTFTDWQLIVVDDGSTDHGLKVVQGFADPRIRVLSQSNAGPGAARNAGIRAATAACLAFLDADDEWYPWYLENAVQVIRKNHVSFVGSMYDEWPQQEDMTRYWAGQGVTPGLYELKNSDPPKWVLSMLYFFRVWNTLVLTEVARKYQGFYDQNQCRLGEDTIFFAKLIFNEPFAIIGPSAVRSNRQYSELSNIRVVPLSAYQTRPEAILKYCSGEKLTLARRVLAFNALRTAHYRAREGHKKDAQLLLALYPETKNFGFFYVRVRCEIIFNFPLTYWCRLKSIVGPWIRSRFGRGSKS
jgi:glycosyltransferase involved in cell wall biosynthesis